MDSVDIYLIARFGHIVSFVIWIGSMVCLPIIMAKHMSIQGNNDEAFISLEKTIMKRVINPFMILTFVFGVWLVFITGAGAPDAGKWIHMKLLSVLVLIAIHVMLSIKRKLLAAGDCSSNAKHFYGLSAIVVGNLVIIAYLAVFKPF